MSDLISRSALLQEFEKYNKLQDRDLWHITGINAFIENQPTAYDVEQVVKELEEKYRIAQTEYSEAKYLLAEMDSKDRNYILQNYRKDMNEGLCFGFDEAIEIVKGGGVNE